MSGGPLPLSPAGGGRGVGPPSATEHSAERECPPPTPSREREGSRKPRFRLGRPTAMAKHLRNNTNDIEDALWQQLRRSQLGGFKFSRQIPRAGAYPDFICRRLNLVVELDGSQHANAKAYDARRTVRLEEQGHTVIRFWNSDVLTNIEGVLKSILAECERLAAISPPPACGRGSGGGLPASSRAPKSDRGPTPNPLPQAGGGSK